MHALSTDYNSICLIPADSKYSIYYGSLSISQNIKFSYQDWIFEMINSIVQILSFILIIILDEPLKCIRYKFKLFIP